MIIINEKALKECREIGFCEVCGDDRILHAHHLIKRGMGGANRLDIKWALVALCPGCHGLADEGRISFDRLAGIVLKRELWKILRTGKE